MKGVAGLLCGLVTGMAAPDAAARGWGNGGRGHEDRHEAVIVCESVRGRRNWCEADTSRGVWLRVQHSRSECIEGVSWGYGRRGIWVSDGCRAEFAIGRSRDRHRDDRYRDDRGVPSGWQAGSWQGRGQTALCESVKGRYQHCPIRGIREAQISRVLSRADCQFGYSWGFDRNGIWVDHGCRAEFAIR
jgi:hypothetical protein